MKVIFALLSLINNKIQNERHIVRFFIKFTISIAKYYKSGKI